MPLPLTVRKGIRDYEAKAKEALQQIKDATGKDFAVEYNWEENAGAIEESYNKDNLGYLYQKEVLENVAYCIADNVKDDLVKEGFSDATSANKIIFRVNPKAEKWFAYVFENGNLIIEHKPSISNTGDLTYVKFAPILPKPSGGLPLPVRQNLSEQKPTGDEYLKSISDATGSGEWTFYANFDAIVPKLDQNTAERLGTIYYSEALYGIDYLLKAKLEDQLVKEAFNAATPNRKITFETNDKLSTWWNISIKDGGLLVQHKPDICNVGDLNYYDLISIIPVSGAISLPAQIDLKENKGSLESAIQEINTATGNEWSFDESSVEHFYAKLDDSEKLRIGAILYKEVLVNLAYNLTNALGDEMVKEAFNETLTAKQVRVAINQGQSNWWDVKFDNGVLVLSAKTPICNTGDVSYLKIDTLL